MKSVIIVGAGPTGASLALLLARRGIPVTLVERESSFHRIFRGEGMMPSGIDALGQMGLRKRLELLPSRRLDRWEIYLGNKLLLQYHEPDREHENAIRVLSQPHLIEMIVGKAARFSDFRLLTGYNVTDVLRGENGKVGVRGAGASGDEELWADYLIATDGRGSLVRKRAGLELDRTLERSPRNHDVFWWSAPLPPWLESETVFYGFSCGDSLATMYPSPTGELRLGWLVPKGTHTKYHEGDPLAELSKRVPEFLREHIAESRTQISEPSFFNVLLGTCPVWQAPGLLLLGDAAHPMNAVRAQGINLGLRDAIVAANHLGPLLASDAPVVALDEAAATIQREREPEIKKAQELQLAASGPPPAFQNPVFRNFVVPYVIPVLARLGLPQRMMLRSERELRYGVVPVRLDR